MKRKLIACFSAALLSFVVSPAATSVRDFAAPQDMKEMTDIGEFESRLASVTGSLSSIESKFVQNKYMDVFQETVRSEGVFKFKSPDKISMKYISPVNYEIIINGDGMKMVSGGQDSKITGNPMFSQIRDMMAACMTGDLSGLSGSFSMSFYENGTTYMVKMSPVSPAVKNYVAGIEIRISKKDMSVERLRINENGTDYTEYVFTDKKYNTITDETCFAL